MKEACGCEHRFVVKDVEGKTYVLKSVIAVRKLHDVIRATDPQGLAAGRYSITEERIYYPKQEEE